MEGMAAEGGLSVSSQEGERDEWSQLAFLIFMWSGIPALEWALPLFRVHLSTSLNLACSHSPQANLIIGN